MQTEINIKASEFNTQFLKRIQEFLKGKKEANIKITISDNDDYFEVLNRSLNDAKDKKNIVSFTLEELLALDPSLKK